MVVKVNKETLKAMKGEPKGPKDKDLPGDVQVAHEPDVTAGTPEVNAQDEVDLPDISLSTDSESGDSEDTKEQVQMEEPKSSEDLNKEVDQTLTEAGFDLKEIEKDILESGEISDSLVQRIKEKVDPLYVDAHLGRIKAELELSKLKAAQQAVPEEAVKEMNDYIFKRVQGEDNFKAMAKYLQSNVPKEEIEVLNDLLLSGNKVKVDMALEKAVDKYNTLKGKGKLMQGDTPAPTPSFVPISKDEFHQIMRTEKYKTDRAYQKDIDARRHKSITIDKEKYPPGVYFARTQDGVRRL